MFILGVARATGIAFILGLAAPQAGAIPPQTNTEQFGKTTGGDFQDGSIPGEITDDGNWFFKYSGIMEGSGPIDHITLSGSLYHKNGPHPNEAGNATPFEFSFVIYGIGPADSSVPWPDGTTKRTKVLKKQSPHGVAPNVHTDTFEATLVVWCRQTAVLPQEWEIETWGFYVSAFHMANANGQDGGPKKPAAPMAAGSDGVAPRVEVWGPTGYVLPVGTSFAAVLLEDVTLPFSLTKPMLMVGPDTDTAFGGTVPIPLDLAPYGAPGFQLAVDPILLVPGFEDAGMHYAIFPFSVPDEPALIGEHFYAQWILNDPAANALGRTFSQAIMVMVAP